MRWSHGGDNGLTGRTGRRVRRLGLHHVCFKGRTAMLRSSTIGPLFLSLVLWGGHASATSWSVVNLGATDACAAWLLVRPALLGYRH